MNKWFSVCETQRVHCVACRTDAAWRESLRASGLVESAEFDCPWGVMVETAAEVQAQAMAKLPVFTGSDEEKKKREEQGRKAWAWLHNQAVADALTPERLEKEFKLMIPAYGCNCSNDWEKDVTANPLPAMGQAQWAVDRHNTVNRKLGKSDWTNPQAQAFPD